MKASEANLLEFLSRSPQFVIPIYQRTYSWTERECTELWNDILRTGNDHRIPAHFVGSIVYVQKGLYQVTHRSPLLVIDGQQRLTTVMLLLEALARRVGEEEVLEGFSAEQIRGYYLLNPKEKEDRRFKMLLTQTDRDSLLALLQQKEKPAEHSIRIHENFEFFESRLDELGEDLTAVCRGLAKLLVVDISLSRDQDNPQLIFESMNSTGRELSQADLIRNYILMGLEPDHQTQLYEDHWRPMEVAFGQEAYVEHFDAFMRHYLTRKTGEIPRLREVYDAFKAYAGRQGASVEAVDELVADLHAYAGYYCALALGKEPDKELRAAFKDLKDLRVDVAYPFLLEVYQDYRQERLTREEVLAIVRLVESYVFRRAVCAIPTNSLNKTFAGLGSVVDKARYVESVQAHLLNLPSYRRFPRDEEFKRELQVRDLYNFRTRSYWLRRMENHGRKERASVEEYTIEHILPQNENLSIEWREALGPEWRRVQETWLHTLGNLTLTGYNAEYSDRPFPVKRDMVGGFRESPLRLNQGLGAQETWDEQAIQSRGRRLAEHAAGVWPAPALPDEVLARYRPSGNRAGGYTIDDHPQLAEGSEMRLLFEALRKELLELDACVVEEFLKKYIAYKAETNFVDVIPQKRLLRLSINVKFHELEDPRGLCEDLTGVSRWGNGDALLKIGTPEEIPYAMSLVRQALERQLGNGEADE